jgi:hypothetical protein
MDHFDYNDQMDFVQLFLHVHNLHFEVEVVFLRYRLRISCLVIACQNHRPNTLSIKLCHCKIEIVKRKIFFSESWIESYYENYKMISDWNLYIKETNHSAIRCLTSMVTWCRNQCKFPTGGAINVTQSKIVRIIISYIKFQNLGIKSSIE